MGAEAESYWVSPPYSPLPRLKSTKNTNKIVHQHQMGCIVCVVERPLQNMEINQYVHSMCSWSSPHKWLPCVFGRVLSLGLHLVPAALRCASVRYCHQRGTQALAAVHSTHRPSAQTIRQSLIYLLLASSLIP